MHNREESQQLLDLMQRLSDESNMIGWLCTVHRNKVHYPKNPEASKIIQQQLNNASNLISITYIWAILDEHGFNERNRWIRSEQRLELKAWKHVRHTGAHAPGGRADRYFQEFNEFMEGSPPGLSGLKKNCEYTEISINLTDGMNYRFFQFAQNLVQSAVGFCANNNPPD